eukprot:365338-Chlamydomonas_euryale.AAC.40
MPCVLHSCHTRRRRGRPPRPFGPAVAEARSFRRCCPWSRAPCQRPRRHSYSDFHWQRLRADRLDAPWCVAAAPTAAAAAAAAAAATDPALRPSLGRPTCRPGRAASARTCRRRERRLGRRRQRSGRPHARVPLHRGCVGTSPGLAGCRWQHLTRVPRSGPAPLPRP